MMLSLIWLNRNVKLLKYVLLLNVSCLILIFSFSCQNSGLNTKKIVSKYSDGVVKIILLDSVQEKNKKGAGYKGRGSGFFITEDGYLFTNRHVVEMCVSGYIDYDYKDKFGKTKSNLTTYSKDIVNDKTITKVYRTGYTTPIIQVYNGKDENDYKLYKAEVVAIGMGAYDGAILKVKSDIDGNPVKEKFNALPIGNSDKTFQGEQLCVYGFPQQFQGDKDLMLRDMSTLSIGIMSGMDYVFNEDYGYIKTDAEIHGGNSGGPVFGENNEVIGIATAVGTKTNIGLIGGINGMFYVAVSNPELQERLLDKGLVAPKRSFSINTTTGKKLPIKTAYQINSLVNSRKKPVNKLNFNSKKSSYCKEKVWFSNISPKENNNYLPPKSKRYNSFTFDKNKGGKIWVYIDNSPSNLNTSQIKVNIYKKRKNKYIEHKKLVYNSNGASSNIYFPYTFYEATWYKFNAFSKEGKYIGTGYFSTSYEPK